MGAVRINRSIRLIPESDEKLQRVAKYLGISVNTLIQKLIDKLDDTGIEAPDRDIEDLIK